jgi:hypothetical protein
MVKYEITTDGGSVYKIEATDDATMEEVKKLKSFLVFNIHL